ncbi:MAG: pseudouridine synthase [Paludibacter sp.]|nr:pseudouridine synthase [Paludibacter sp.]
MRNENEKRPRVHISRPGSASRDGVNNNSERANGGDRFSGENSRPRPRFNNEERDGNRRSSSEQRPERRTYGTERSGYGDRRPNAYGSERSDRPRFGGSSSDKPRFGSDGQRPSYNRSSSDGERPRFGGDRGASRPYNADRTQDNRFNRSSGDGERPRFGGDRNGSRPSGDGERPRFGGDRSGGRSYNSDRPRFGGSSSDKPRFGGDGERPSYNRSSSDGERPRFGGDRSQDSRSGGYRPSFGGDRNGGRSFGDKISTFRKPFTKRDGDYDPNAKYSQKKQIEYKKQFVDYSKPMRLNKFLANAGLCSRREADEFIQAGVVTVNGQPITELGAKIIPATDKVLFHDQLVRSEKRVYILLNKPKDCVTTADDPQARLTVLDLVKNACSERVYPVGRLDRHTTGVLLITNDGDLTSKMTHPKYNQKKIYQAVLDHDVTPEDMDKLRNGFELEDGEIHVDEINYVDEADHREVGVEIHSGRNRIVRRMFDHLGYKVVRLDRVYFAGLTKKNLPRGKWRHLSEMEVNMLKMSN